MAFSSSQELPGKGNSYSVWGYRTLSVFTVTFTSPSVNCLAVTGKAC